MSSNGYYKMHRGWMDHAVLGGGKFSRRDAWVWLIEEASWTDRRRDIGGRTVELRRGQLTASVRFLAEAWGWPKSVVGRFIDRLETETMIGTDSGTGQLIITICNYDKYQTTDDTEGTANGTHSGTGAGQERDKLEEGKERKKRSTSTAHQDRNGFFGEPIPTAEPDDFDTFWRAYPSRTPHANPKKPARDKFHRAVNRGIDPTAIIRGAEVYAATVSRQSTDPRYIAQAQTWLGQERWAEYQRAPEPAKTRSKEFVP